MENEAIISLKDKIKELERITDNFLDVPMGELRKANKEIEMCNVCVSALEEIQQYRAIGTVEECWEERERQIPKKPLIKSKKVKIQTGDYVYVKCPCCGEDIFSCFHYMPWNDSQKSHKRCENCGQAIDWSE